MLTGLVSLGDLQEAKKEEAQGVFTENYAGPKPQSHEQVKSFWPQLSASGASQVVLLLLLSRFSRVRLYATVNNQPANAGDPGLSPGLGSSPGGGNDNPLQYSCLENLVDRGTQQVTVCEIAKSWTQQKRQHACSTGGSFTPPGVEGCTGGHSSASEMPPVTPS